MIYIDSEKKTDFKKEFVKLAEYFPYSFNEKGVLANALPIQVELAGQPYKAAFFKKGMIEMPLGARNASMDTIHRLSGNGTFANETGTLSTWVYTKTAPTIKGGEKVFAKQSIEFKLPFTLNPAKDLEKIIALFFYSPAFTNNERALRDGGRNGGKYKFIFVGEKSKKTIDTIAFQTKYANMLILEGSRFSDKQFEELSQLLAFVSTGVMEEDRLSMYNLVTSDAKFRERFDRIATMISEDSKKTEVVLDAAKIVTKARAAKVLVIEDNMWVTKNENGVTQRTIAETRGEKQPEKNEALVEFLNASQDDLEHIKSLLD
jgi:hypothetical protein